MLRFTSLVLFSALVAVGSKININKQVDDGMKYSNKILRDAGATSAPFPEIPISKEVSYSNATALGFDSLYRTGDCWMDQEDKSTSLDFHYGYRMLVLDLPRLTIDGDVMSAYLRVRNNSVRMSYTVHPGSRCYVTLDDFRVERLADVEFGASRADYDNKDLNSFFQNQVVPALNGIVKEGWHQIEKSLQGICHKPHPDHSTYISGAILYYLTTNVVYGYKT